MSRYLAVLLWAILLGWAAPRVVLANPGAQEQVDGGHTDTLQEVMPVRSAEFDQAAIDRLLKDSSLDYDRTVHEQKLWLTRLMQRLGYWLIHKLERLFGTQAGRFLFRNLYWVVILAAVIILVVLLRKRMFSGVLGQSPTAARQVRELMEDPSRLDLDRLLADAEQRQDWRGALRFQYLKVLRRLVDDGSIRWHPKHTDLDYLRQLKDPGQRARFSELSFLFHWAWYGDAPVDADRYHRLAPDFISFHAGRGPKP